MQIALTITSNVFAFSQIILIMIIILLLQADQKLCVAN